MHKKHVICIHDHLECYNRLENVVFYKSGLFNHVNIKYSALYNSIKRVVIIEC